MIYSDFKIYFSLFKLLFIFISVIIMPVRLRIIKQQLKSGKEGKTLPELKSKRILLSNTNFGHLLLDNTVCNQPLAESQDIVVREKPRSIILPLI